MSVSILRIRGLLARTGNKRSTAYDRIKKGLLPPPISIGGTNSGWPDNEIDAVNAARIAGKSDDEIRELVKSLVAARKSVTARMAA